MYLVPSTTKLTPKQKDFLEWLCTPPAQRVPSNQKEWGRANQVHHNTLSAWRKDPAFRQAWDQRLRELQVDPENIDVVMKALYAKAAAGSEKAIQMYLAVVEEFRPPKEVDPRELRTPLRELTDAELRALIAAHAEDELEARAEVRGS